MAEIKNLAQAVSVLIQGVEIGKAKGIYSWEDLELLGASMKFIKAINESVENSAKQSEQVESVSEETVEPIV